MAAPALRKTETDSWGREQLQPWFASFPNFNFQSFVVSGGLIPVTSKITVHKIWRTRTSFGFFATKIKSCQSKEKQENERSGVQLLDKSLRRTKVSFIDPVIFRSPNVDFITHSLVPALSRCDPTDLQQCQHCCLFGRLRYIQAQKYPRLRFAPLYSSSHTSPTNFSISSLVHWQHYSGLEGELHPSLFLYCLHTCVLTIAFTNIIGFSFVVS